MFILHLSADNQHCDWTGLLETGEKHVFLYKQKSCLTGVSIYYSCPISSPNCRVETKNLIPLLPRATTSGHILNTCYFYLLSSIFTVDILAEALITLHLDNYNILIFIFSSNRQLALSSIYFYRLNPKNTTSPKLLPCWKGFLTFYYLLFNF